MIVTHLVAPLRHLPDKGDTVTIDVNGEHRSVTVLDATCRPDDASAWVWQVTVPVPEAAGGTMNVLVVTPVPL